MFVSYPHVPHLYFILCPRQWAMKIHIPQCALKDLTNVLNLRNKKSLPGLERPMESISRDVIFSKLVICSFNHLVRSSSPLDQSLLTAYRDTRQPSP